MSELPIKAHRTSLGLLGRYQACAVRIWGLFPSDPLPDDDPAHFWIDRLESILDRELLAVKEPTDYSISGREIEGNEEKNSRSVSTERAAEAADSES